MTLYKLIEVFNRSVLLNFEAILDRGYNKGHYRATNHSVAEKILNSFSDPRNIVGQVLAQSPAAEFCLFFITWTLFLFPWGQGHRCLLCATEQPEITLAFQPTEAGKANRLGIGSTVVDEVSSLNLSDDCAMLRIQPGPVRQPCIIVRHTNWEFLVWKLQDNACDRNPWQKFIV